MVLKLQNQTIKDGGQEISLMSININDESPVSILNYTDVSISFLMPPLISQLL